jgi:hypothetical protein
MLEVTVQVIYPGVKSLLSNLTEESLLDKLKQNSFYNRLKKNIF